ncbi:gliding motility-associated C-terminal domain-containing protein [Adhaeribacter sp. BT258]|uniref:Gliding motility-associated C-terminal domain-containing protein n=1 Tax=Adhaeribacter terrigena TaxID=2793070 RepID=A0ABS1C2G6_9BACT|nr:gliding motility-associated C-terminal domain-containing protein [Adhaeribacter terrigena]MBK0403341.1 gliding motility-associated C-terminal domain-containing protein [Adhaeribacter terrigena]
MKISGLYTATGGERYLTIGNFKSNLASNFQRLSFNDTIREIPATYFLDDVSVIPVTATNYSLHLGPDTIYCDNKPINQTLAAPAGFAAYEWSTGATTASIQVAQPGTYWVNADFGCGFLSDTIRIDTKPSFIAGFELGNDTVICAQGPFRLPLRTKRGFTTYRWNTGDTTQNIFATAPGTYWVTATYDCGSISDTIVIEQFQPGRLFSFTDTVLCEGESVTLIPAAGFAAYKWHSGETSLNLVVSQPGKYKVTATSAAGCSVSDSVTVRLKAPFLGFSLGKDIVLCENQTLKLNILAQPGFTYLWNDGVKMASRTINKPGIYKLTASDRCSSFSDEMEVKYRDCNTIFVPNIITPNHDTHNDLFEIATPTNRKLDLKIYNRWGVLVYEKQDYRNDWPKGNISSGTYYYLLSDPQLNKTYKGWLEVAK